MSLISPSMRYSLAAITCFAAFSQAAPIQQSESIGGLPGTLFNLAQLAAHAADVAIDGPLRLIPGVDCLVPDPKYDGLTGSFGNNHGKPDCKSLKTLLGAFRG